MSLGSKLQETLAILEDAKITSAALQHAADMEKIAKDRAAAEALIAELRHVIVTDISSGKVPYVKIDKHWNQSWIEKAADGTAPFQSLWDDFRQEMKKEALTIHIKDASDGGGQRNWLNLTVTPVKPGHRSVAEVQQKQRTYSTAKYTLAHEREDAQVRRSIGDSSDPEVQRSMGNGSPKFS